ncbi:DNA adenine methylase [Aureibaculum conchae]|uniref:DNA adenine methylase n=1 Tax=Aureibaculum sp. 2308TA14-22 TaxID=3108392 RepID=UPI003394CF4F
MSQPNLQLKEEKVVCKPFLRWTGSKSWFVKSLLKEYLPKNFNNYHECFLGGASVFFSLQPQKKAYLYDTNTELIETYIQLRDNLDLVIKSLKRLKNTEEEYYRIRKTNSLTPHTRAAKFIYLNRCSFNGIYRVNRRGEYNVPYGKRKNVDIVTEENLKLVSESLKGIEIINHDFSLVLENLKPKDLVFLDPPYTVAHEHNGFIEYNQNLFSLDDQKRLAELTKEIDKKGAYFILTNAAHKTIRNIYHGVGKIRKVERYSKVGGRAKTRGMFNEFIITNIFN